MKLAQQTKLKLAYVVVEVERPGKKLHLGASQLTSSWGSC
jgi:hypothetical protein